MLVYRMRAFPVRTHFFQEEAVRQPPRFLNPMILLTQQMMAQRQRITVRMVPAQSYRNPLSSAQETRSLLLHISAYDRRGERALRPLSIDLCVPTALRGPDAPAFIRSLWAPQPTFERRTLIVTWELADLEHPSGLGFDDEPLHAPSPDGEPIFLWLGEDSGQQDTVELWNTL